MKEYIVSKKSIKLNAILSSVKTVVSMLVSLVTFPYVSRALQVEAVGKHTFAASVVSYFILLAELGIHTYAVREGTRLRNDRGRISSFASEILSIQTTATVISMILLAVLTLTVPKLQDYWLLLLLLSIQIPLAAFGRSWIYSVYEDFGYITVTQLACQVVAVVLMFAFVRTPEDLYSYVIVYLISHSGSNLLYGLHSKKYIDIHRIDLRNLKKHFIPILVIFSTTVSTTIYVNSDTTILGWLVDDTAVGLYSIAVKVYTIVKQVIAAVITVVIPRLTLYAGTDHFNPFFNRVLKTLSLMVLPAMTGLFILSDNVIEIVGGQEYLAATTSMQLLSIALGGSLFACLYATGALIPNMQEKPFMVATIISAVVNIVLNFVLIPYFQQEAAAFTTLVAEFLTLAICYYFARRYATLEGVGKTLLTVGIGCGAIAAVCLVIRSLGLSLYPETILCIVASVAVYCFIQLILKNEIFLQSFRSMLNMIAKKTSKK